MVSRSSLDLVDHLLGVPRTDFVHVALGWIAGDQVVSGGGPARLLALRERRSSRRPSAPHRRLPTSVSPRRAGARGDHAAFGGEAVLGEDLAVVLRACAPMSRGSRAGPAGCRSPSRRRAGWSRGTLRASQTGGWGDWSGLGSTSMPSYDQYLAAIRRASRAATRPARSPRSRGTGRALLDAGARRTPLNSTRSNRGRRPSSRGRRRARRPAPTSSASRSGL